MWLVECRAGWGTCVLGCDSENVGFLGLTLDAARASPLAELREDLSPQAALTLPWHGAGLPVGLSHGGSACPRPQASCF